MTIVRATPRASALARMRCSRRAKNGLMGTGAGFVLVASAKPGSAKAQRGLEVRHAVYGDLAVLVRQEDRVGQGRGPGPQVHA